MILHCPSCDEELEFDFDPRGQTFDCPACNYRFTVPTVLNFLIIAGGILVFLAAPGIADLISK